MAWIPVAAGGALIVSLLVGLLVAAVLGELAARISELDDQHWTAMQLTAGRSRRDW